MSDRYFVDTNILLYAHDTTAGAKHLRAKALLQHLWQSQQGLLSTQVLQEFCANIRKKCDAPISLHEVQAIVQDYLTWEVVTNAPQAISRALDFEARYRISFWDALILRSAEEGGASIVYSEDLTSGQRYGSVQVINPLTDSFAIPS